MSSPILTSDLLSERSSTHGPFAQTAACSDAIKQIFQNQQNWSNFSPVQREALCQIAMKLSRILCGDHRFVDHWQDVIGYCQLVLTQSAGDATND
jgi:hypothetical protein